jgi:hypothetical protein
MPFTPLHMGPGIAIKAIARRRFSLMVFGWSQILMDLQPLISMATGKLELHGFSHTILGATLIAIPAALTGKPLGEFGLKVLKMPEHLPITWPVAFLSAYIGTYSHILLDSIMHTDVQALAPFRHGNRLQGIISIEALHILCIAAAAIGGVIYLIREGLIRRQNQL